MPCIAHRIGSGSPGEAVQQSDIRVRQKRLEDLAFREPGLNAAKPSNINPKLTVSARLCEI